MRFIPTGELIVHEAMAFEVKIKGLGQKWNGKNA